MHYTAKKIARYVAMYIAENTAVNNYTVIKIIHSNYLATSHFWNNAGFFLT